MSRQLVSPAERSHKDFFFNSNSLQRELGPPVKKRTVFTQTLYFDNTKGVVCEQAYLFGWGAATECCTQTSEPARRLPWERMQKKWIRLTDFTDICHSVVKFNTTRAKFVYKNQKKIGIWSKINYKRQYYLRYFRISPLVLERVYCTITLIRHVTKVKSNSSAHSLADVIPFLAYLIFPPNPMLR